MQKLRKSIINHKKARLGGILLAFIMAFGATIGFLNLAKALPGDAYYWTTTYDGLSMTVTSVSQHGVELIPQEDGEGGYYFAVANNTEAVTVGIRVEGMVQGETYYYYPTSPWWTSSRVDLTYEDNGIVIYEELEPTVTFDDNYYLSGIYHVEASINRDHGYGIQKNITVRPTSVGSHSIDIVSVKQGSTDLALVDNEYQIANYNTPVTLTYKFKNLEVGKTYSVNVGRDYWYQFKAEATETAETTRELTLNLADRHTSTSIDLQNSDTNEQVALYFAVADSNFNQLGNIIIDEIEQGGVALVPEANTSGWQREYTFSANDAQGLTVRMHTTRATADMNYYVMFNMNSYGYGGGYSSEEPLMVTGADLEQAGAVLTIPAPYGLSESSPVTLSFTVNTTGVDTHDYDNSRNVVYKNYAEPQNTSDVFKFNVQVDESVPRYDAAMYYSDGTMIDSDRISPLYHDADHPLLLEVHGERYDSGTTYSIRAKVAEAYGETFYDRTFTATGAELNEGTVLTLTGLTLSLPEFDPTGATSGYELAYDFSLSIDGLSQRGTMYYAYDGWLRSSMTYNDGEVVAMGAGGGIGGDIYSTINATTVRKSSLSGSRGATLQYLAGAFDEDLSYDFAVYYNGNAGEAWWSASAGNRIENGVITGSYLNDNGLSINLAAPSNESESVLYTVVISRNGSLVRLAKDYISFTTEPKIESFKFTADSDSFMQIDRTSYRVASGTDIVATLTGDGFENDAEYRLWVTYNGYRYAEENEYGYSYPDEVDLSALDDSIVVTGAQLNAGYVYNLNYVEALDATNFIEVDFAVSDKNAERPTWAGETGNGYYSGHSIRIDYVNEDEVFRDNGYQVNEDGTVTDVSQPDDPHGPDNPEEVPVDIKTPGDVDVIVDGTGLTVVSRKPTLVIGYKNGHYTLVTTTGSVDNDGEKTNSYNISGYEEVKVVLKGDIDMRGTLNARDSARIDYYLLAADNPNHRDLNELELLIADINGRGGVTARDASLLDYAILSAGNPNHRDLPW